MNYDKTKFMVLSNRVNNVSITNNKLKICDKVIEKVDNFKFLGVIIDNKLRFDCHIDSVTLKLSRVLGTFKRLNFLPPYILRMLYFSLVHSNLTYGILLWGSASNLVLNKLVVLQKKIIRVITGSGWYDHTSHLFKEYRILKLDNIFDYFLNLYMYKIINSEKHYYVMNEIYSNSVNHSYLTRAVNELRTPFFRKSNVYPGKAAIWHN